MNNPLTSNKYPLDIDILAETIDDLSVGVGIFYVENLNDLKSIRYTFMNKVLLYEMRKERDEVFGKRIIDVAPEAFEHEGGMLVMETYRSVAENGGSVNLGLVEYSNEMVAGTYECSVHYIRDNYVYVMLRNVTELEQAKNELEVENKELNQMAYLVSHDLKAPLRTISSFITLLNDRHTEQFSEEALKLFTYISTATERMVNLVTDILDYSIVGKGKKLSEVDTAKLIREVQEDLSVIIQESNTTFEVIQDLPVLTGYETELRMLFQNIINNAIKFRKKNTAPVIKIYAEKKNGWTFFIQDNGIGIDEEHQGKIFDVFQRLHSKSDYEGTGIGLSHCKKIVDLHNGKIGVTSNVNEGSTFHFSIPDSL